MDDTAWRIPFREVDDFTLDTLLYEGQHTLLYLGCQKNLERQVIIKVLKPHVNDNREWMERFQREARVCARLKHPNIVEVYRLGERDGFHYIAIEYVRGISLKELLQKAGKLPLNMAFNITEQLLRALSFVHQHQILHRDIKPGNILIDFYGQVKLADFGLAQIGEESRVTRQGTLIGTPAYMAPEQISGVSVDARADLFGLGAVLYEMLSGTQPFSGENVSNCLYKIMNEHPPLLNEVHPGIPLEIAAFVDTFLQKSVEARWQDADSALDRLHQLCTQMNITFQTEQIAEFIRPYLHNLPDKPGCSGTLTKEEPRMDEPNAPRTLTKGRKRRMLLGGIGVFVLLLLFGMWWRFAGSETIPLQHAGGKSLLTVADSTDNRDSLHQPVSPELTSTPETSSTTIDTSAEKSLPNESESTTVTGRTRRVVNEHVSDKRPAEHSPIEPSGVPSTPVENGQSRLAVQVEPWARVLIDGKETASRATQHTFSVPPGKHALTLVHPNFPPQQFYIEMKPGEQKAVTWSFLKNVGFLQIEVRPWAEVYIDDKLRDTTPLREPLLLSAGEHLMELKHPYLLPYREYITIQEGDTLHLQVVLKKK